MTDRERQVTETMEALGVDRLRAEFIVALDRGETTGDDLVVDDDRPPARTRDEPPPLPTD